jgi:transposase
MFIRETITKNPRTGATYKVHRLVEAVRTPKGPRQRVVLHLGILYLTKIERKKLAKLLEKRLLGQASLFEDESKLSQIADQAMVGLAFRKTAEQEKNTPSPSDLQTVDLESTQLVKIRVAGPEIIGHSFWNALGLPGVLRELGLDASEVALAEASVLGRLIHPGSERGTHAWVNRQSALLELLGHEKPLTDKNRFYEIADLLLANKPAIEAHLRRKEVALFPCSTTLFLYDLTNTYFEGQARKNSLAKRGHSKEKRSDRPLVTLALLVDSQGFPVFSQIYRGNQAEPETLGEVLSRLEKDFGGILPSLRPTIVMDKGIATSGNVRLIREKSFPYAIVERRRAEKDYADVFANPSDFTSYDTHSGPIKVKKIALEDRVRVLVISEGRVQKERAMDSLKEQRYKSAVEQLASSVAKGNVVMTEKVGRRIGRILQQFPSMAHFYEIVATPDPTGQRVVRVEWRRKEDSPKEEAIRGCYVIETSHVDQEAKAIWDLYTTLHKVEKAFRSLKTDLGFRPIHHQLDTRTEGHLFISVLAYHLMVATERRLRMAGDHRSWDTIRKTMSTLVRGTITMADSDGNIHSIRTTSAMEPEHRQILNTLGIQPSFPKIRHHLRARL